MITFNYEGDLEVAITEKLLSMTAEPREFRDCLEDGVLDDVIDLLDVVKQHIAVYGITTKERCHNE